MAGFALAASFSVALTLCVFSVQAPAFAALSDDPNLVKLEQKFFQHSYPKESNEERLDRLEKMIFGEAKDGNERERLDNLVSAVPSLNAPADDVSGSGAGTGGTGGGNGARGGNSRNSGGSNVASDDDPGANKPQKVEGESKYPAVTAMEQKVLGKEYTGEPVAQRLARLETKVFGKPSGIDDLTDRMDRLKSKTGIDIARQAPPGSDWDDEDDIDFPAPSTARRPAPYQYQPKPGDDGRSFSGRDLRQDMQKAFGSPGNRSITGGGTGGSGSYGMGSGVGIGGGSGSYGMSPPRSFGGSGTGSNIGMGAGSGYPSGIPTAPPIASRQPAPPSAMAGGMGLSQTVSVLETEIFGKNYAKDPLPARVARLEATVFPQQSPANERTLPDRINRLTSVVPISSGQAPPRVAQGNNNRQDPEMDDLDFQNPQVAQGQNPQVNRNGGGLGKIINSISNFLTGGFSGGYAMPSGSLVTDPQTGLLLDQFNGNLIDPNSGMVVGRRAPAYPAYPSPGIPSFNNGFSSPYGMPFGGGSGIRFGTGGFGFGGGMWP